MFRSVVLLFSECIAIYGGGGKWYDKNCFLTQPYFIVEFGVPGISQDLWDQDDTTFDDNEVRKSSVTFFRFTLHLMPYYFILWNDVVSSWSSRNRTMTVVIELPWKADAIQIEEHLYWTSGTVCDQIILLSTYVEGQRCFEAQKSVAN